MGRCEVCGNTYEKTFQILKDGRSWTFDSFECAIHALAPLCAHCQCRILGHGLEDNGLMYCCAHCVRHAGQQKRTAEDQIKGSYQMSGKRPGRTAAR